MAATVVTMQSRVVEMASSCFAFPLSSKLEANSAVKAVPRLASQCARASFLGNSPERLGSKNPRGWPILSSPCLLQPSIFHCQRQRLGHFAVCARASSSSDPVPHPKQDPLVVVARAAPWICAAALVATGLMVVYSPSSSFSRPLVSFTKPLVDVCVNTMKPHSHILGTVWTGLATGCLHTLTGPDHLAALAPLTIGRSRAMSAVLGALWGGGHGTGQMLLGLVFLLFKDRISHMLPMLSRWSGTLVGLTLVAIGAVGVLEAKHLEKEAPKADGASTDMEGVDMEVVEAVSKSKHIGLATYANGIVFGLQPDALMVVLPALALPSKLSIAAFLTTFMLGTMLAMGSYTAFIGAASHALGKRMPWVTQRLSLIAGIIAITFGGAFIASNVFAVGPLACA